MIGDLVRQRREAKGWTQTELALHTGLRQVYISQVENGDIKVPRDHNLDTLGQALGVTRAEFYRAAGMFNDLPADAMPPPRLAAPEVEDKAWDPAKLVAWVEAHPDEQFRRGLAEDAELMSPEEYEEYVLAIARAWLANGQLAQRIARLGRQYHQHRP